MSCDVESVIIWWLSNPNSPQADSQINAMSVCPRPAAANISDELTKLTAAAVSQLALPECMHSAAKRSSQVVCCAARAFPRPLASSGPSSPVNPGITQSQSPTAGPE